jgi:hypothetical protein
VLFIGVAILFLRYEQKTAPNHQLSAGWWLVTWLILVGFLTAAAVIARIQHWSTRRGDPFFSSMQLRVILGVLLFWSFVSLLVIVGAAAGIK